jgi:hypothetical protein
VVVAIRINICTGGCDEDLIDVLCCRLIVYSFGMSVQCITLVPTPFFSMKQNEGGGKNGRTYCISIRFQWSSPDVQSQTNKKEKTADSRQQTADKSQQMIDSR